MKKEDMRPAIYARVSKGHEQNPENQLSQLDRWAEVNGVSIPKDRVFVDEISSRDRRPKKEELLKLIRLGYVNTVVVTRLDRWGRNADELILELDEFRRNEINFVSLREGLDLSTATGRLYANMLAIFADFERDLIQERTMDGLRRAKAQGGLIGRHPKGCGCGWKSDDGKRVHNGVVQPVRDAKNRHVGWQYPGGRVVYIRKLVDAPAEGV